MIVNETPGRLCLNADKSAIVADGSADAAFVLAGPGGVIPAEFVDLYVAHVAADADAAPDSGSEKVVEPEHEAKAAPKKRPAKKAAAVKSDG